MNTEDNWAQFIPWFLTIACSAVLIALGVFFIENIYWFRLSAFSNIDISDSYYRIHVYHMHLSMMKRAVGLFTGFALLFLGTGVVFYTLKSMIHFETQTTQVSTKLVTASPGIVAMILGAILIMFTVASKDNFAPYNNLGPQQIDTSSATDSMYIPPKLPI